MMKSKTCFIQGSVQQQSLIAVRFPVVNLDHSSAFAEALTISFTHSWVRVLPLASVSMTHGMLGYFLTE